MHPNVLFFLIACLSANPAVAAPACVTDAANHYGVDTMLVQAILKVEGGRIGMRQPNRNGSYDMGPMQINSSWLPRLSTMGVREESIVWDYCTNVAVGTWILARELGHQSLEADRGAFWQAVGRYHSRNPARNAAYAVRVWYQTKLLQSTIP